MSERKLRRRELLLAASGGCTVLAGCSEGDPSDASTEAASVQEGYGAAYGLEYGAN
ncbi:hypothetical protein ACFQGT_10300 [Natrialbaceae archaeon GCM10025810]|uniref:hypothetical protein n=1 Tax=Halovalidus salilacus TaxID=3075124 RepID=UPI00360BD07B